jgi:hypothetical protein
MKRAGKLVCKKVIIKCIDMLISRFAFKKREKRLYIYSSFIFNLDYDIDINAS